MSKTLQGQNWDLTPAADGRRYSKYPAGDAPAELPAKINNFVATTVTSSAVTFTWDADPLATSYTLGRGLGDGFGGVVADSFVADVATVSAPTTTIVDEGPVGGFVEGQEYYWRVAGVNATGQGDGATRIFLEPNEAVTPPAPPSDVVAASIIWQQNFNTLATAVLVAGANYGSGSGVFTYRQTGSPDAVAQIVGSGGYEGDKHYLSMVPAAGSSGGSYRSDLMEQSALRNKTDWEGLELFVGYAMKLAADAPVKTDPVTGPYAVTAQGHNLDWLDPFYVVSPTVTVRVQPSTSEYIVTRKWINADSGTRSTGTYQLTSGADYTADRGVWVRWVWQVGNSSDKSGFIRIWKNDVLVFELLNVETYPPEPGYGYFGFSNYRAGMKTQAGPKLELAYDSLRIACVTPFAGNPGGGNYATVNPGSYV